MTPRDNHKAAPLTAAFVHAMRETFGPVKVVYVSEGPVNLGTPLPASVNPVLVDYGLVDGKRLQFTVSGEGA